MFESRHRSSGGSSANRWLIVAGAGMVILAFVARMLLDIGHTRVSDLAAGVLRQDSTVAPAPDPVPAPPRDSTRVSVQEPVAPPATAAPVESTPPAPPPPKVVVAASPPPVLKAGGFAVQIGAFGAEPNATRLAERSRGLGYPAEVLPQPRNGTTLYLVRVTGLSSAEAARQASDSLARSLGVKAVVVRPVR